MGPSVNRRVPLLNASPSLSPHGTGERAREASHELLVTLARRSLRAPARAAPPRAHRANPRTSAQKDEAPEACTWGASLTDTSTEFAWKDDWLRIRRWLRTRSQRSQRDGLRALALSRDCKCLRIRVVGRCDPGHSHGFAPSRDERGAKRDRRAHVRRWRAFEAPRGPGALGRETGHTGETGRRHPGPNVPST